MSLNSRRVSRNEARVAVVAISALLLVVGCSSDNIPSPIHDGELSLTFDWPRVAKCVHVQERAASCEPGVSSQEWNYYLDMTYSTALPNATISGEYGADVLFCTLPASDLGFRCKVWSGSTRNVGGETAIYVPR